MNERIRELAEQAGFVSWANETWKPEGEVFDWSTNYDYELKKFAELIVQKCVSIVALHGITNFENQDISWACENITKEVKEHFGVE